MAKKGKVDSPMTPAFPGKGLPGRDLGLNFSKEPNGDISTHNLANLPRQRGKEKSSSPLKQTFKGKNLGD